MQELIEVALEYLRGVWRYRWYALVVAWAVACAGWAWVYMMPDRYAASARVFVDTQSLLQPLMSRLTVSPRSEEQVAMVTRTLLSRPNIEEVARRSDLDLAAETPREMEQLIDGLQRQIKLSSAGNNLYTISFVHESPAKARVVVQSLLDIFVESSLGNTREDIASSQTFINSQIERYKKDLKVTEDRIKAFKRENYALLPGQGRDYYGRLREAEQQLAQARLELEEATRARNAYRARMSGTEPTLLSPPPPPAARGQQGSSAPSALDQRIANLESELDQLLLQYTERHPDVLATRRVLEDLKTQREAQPPPAPAASSGPSSPAASGGGMASGQSYEEQLRFSLAEAEARVESLQARVDEFSQRYERLRAAVDRIPAVEAEYRDLTRDYEVLKANYQSLLATREKATISEDLQTQTKSVDFRVVDPPYASSTPVGPNRVMFSAAVLIAALGSGVAFAFGLSQLRPVIGSRGGLERLTNRPLLGTVRFADAPRLAFRRRLALAAYAGSVMALVGLFGGLTILYTST